LLVSANGGAGDDRYTGGPGQDRFRGGLGSDIVNGGNGSDFCDAETESACELDFPPPPKIRVP
jgi:RTX calcium-binding nonapeptide repeat (4 copies)